MAEVAGIPHTHMLDAGRRKVKTRRCIWAWILVVFLAGCSPVPESIVHASDCYHPAEIIELELSATRMMYAFRGEDGIFRFDIAPLPESVEEVTFVLYDQANLESVLLFPPDGAAIDIYSPFRGACDGVVVTQAVATWRITFSGTGLELLREGGTLQVVDWWRW